jgi:NAD(P)-dependent dehydrogenase (short-subunit alcohol dehydrogenase family)
VTIPADETTKPRRALVMGAGTDGIGRGVVRALAAAGMRVGIHHRAEPEAAAALAAESGGGPVVQADIADPEAARAAVRDAAAALGGLDVLVFCCAVLLRKPFLETTDADWAQVHSVNLAGAFAAAQEAARLMLPQKFGRIVLVSSVNEFAPNAGLAAYAASKGGLKMLARVMALELAPHGITVNLVAPGTILTDLNRAAMANDDWRAAKQRLIPAGRLGAPADIGAVAAFLASDAAGYVTGATLVADGGLTLGVQP